jgi:phenylalanyl-tRNA synthetase beta chain
VKVPISWLRDFVDVTVPAEELGEALTLRGFQLSAIEMGAGAICDDDDD